MSTFERNDDYAPEYYTPDYATGDADQGSVTEAAAADQQAQAQPADPLQGPSAGQQDQAEPAPARSAGPDFSGPGYESAYDTSDEAATDVYDAAPEALPAPAPSPAQYTPTQSTDYYQPPMAGPAPVVPPAPQQQYGYQAQPQQYGYQAQAGYGVAPQPYGTPQPYGFQRGYGYAGYVPDHPQSSTIMVLGIVGIFVGICAPIAWFLGGKAKREVAAGAPYRFPGSANTGYVLGIVFTLLHSMWWLMIMIGIFSSM